MIATCEREGLPHKKAQANKTSIKDRMKSAEKASGSGSMETQDESVEEVADKEAPEEDAELSDAM